MPDNQITICTNMVISILLLGNGFVHTSWIQRNGWKYMIICQHLKQVTCQTMIRRSNCWINYLKLKMKLIMNELSIGAVVYALLEYRIFYLLLNYISGHWDFPKGNKEENETELETITREIKEETGIENIEIQNNFRKQIFYTYKRNNTLISKRVIYYLAKTNTMKVILSDEHMGSKWVEYTEALNSITYKNSKDVLVECNKLLNKKFANDL